MRKSDEICEIWILKRNSEFSSQKSENSVNLLRKEAKFRIFIAEKRKLSKLVIDFQIWASFFKSLLDFVSSVARKCTVLTSTVLKPTRQVKTNVDLEPEEVGPGSLCLASLSLSDHNLAEY